MSELSHFLSRPRRYSTAILKNPTGAKVPYSIVGSVPLSVCNYGIETGNPKALFNSEEEAKQALIDIGMPFFQMADCSWFPYKPGNAEDDAKLTAFWNS